VVLGEPLGVVPLGVPLAEVGGAAVPVPPGERDGRPDGGEPPVQADTDVVASIAKTAQPSTVLRKRRRP